MKLANNCFLLIQIIFKVEYKSYIEIFLQKGEGTTESYILPTLAWFYSSRCIVYRSYEDFHWLIAFRSPCFHGKCLDLIFDLFVCNSAVKFTFQMWISLGDASFINLLCWTFPWGSKECRAPVFITYQSGTWNWEHIVKTCWPWIFHDFKGSMRGTGLLDEFKNHIHIYVHKKKQSKF